jgi:putative heme transporter
VRAVGIPASQVSFLEVLLSFAVARLAGAIPVTPGGLGTVDAAFIGMLTAFGATSNDALAADMVWRATTYFPPIFIGIVTYLIWKRGLAKGTYANDPDVTLSAVPADG